MPRFEDEEESSGSGESEDFSGQGQKKAVGKPIIPVKKFAGEDEEEDSPASDWEESSDDDSKRKPAASTTLGPTKKKGTLKAKLAEKEAEKATRGGDDDDDGYDSDEILNPTEKARRDKERELNADLANAADLLGSAALGGTSSKALDNILSAQPRTLTDFHKLADSINSLIIAKHQSKPLYAAFVEHFVKQLAIPLKDVEVRKAASGLTTLANEKQKEQRDKASGKKKTAKAKPALGAAKGVGKADTRLYEDALDDFGANDDDFM